MSCLDAGSYKLVYNLSEYRKSTSYFSQKSRRIAMKTSIRIGQHPFYGDKTFPHGISRSGYFNKRESDELALYGKTFESLSNGTLTPVNDEETQFVEAITHANESDLYSVNLWRKYLAALEKSRVHHGFSKSNGTTRDTGGNDYSFA